MCALAPAYVPCTQKLLNEHVRKSTQISRFFRFQKSKEDTLQKCWTKLNRSKFLNVVVLKVPFDSSLRKIEIIYVFSNHQTYLNNSDFIVDIWIKYLWIYKVEWRGVIWVEFCIILTFSVKKLFLENGQKRNNIYTLTKNLWNFEN